MSENRMKRKKYSWIVVAAMVAGAVIGSGIVRHSAKWVAYGGSYAVYGLFLVWFAFFIVGIAMSDNVSMMEDKGGVYGWTRRTCGPWWGTQIGWIYLVGFMCLSVILCWLAYVYTLVAITHFFPAHAARLYAEIFSIIIPMFFIVVFTFSFTLGVKKTTQVIVGFFTVKVTMWLTIVGIGLLHYNPEAAVNYPSTNSEPLFAALAVSAGTIFAVQGMDASSLVSDDIHKPGKNFLKGFIIGMLIVLILYISTIIIIWGLAGQAGADRLINNGEGIIELFLQELNVPPPVLLVFVVISILGTLYINMYMVVRMTGAMAENYDFYYARHAIKHIEEQKPETLDGLYHAEMPKSSMIISILIYAIFFFLIWFERQLDTGTQFMLHVVDNLGIYPFLVVLFFISLTNLKAHRQGLSRKRREEKNEFKWARGLYMVIPVVGMIAVAFICGLYTWILWTNPPAELPQSPAQSKYWEFWLYLGLIFPAFMVVPGLLYYGLRGRKKTLPIPGMPVKQEVVEQRAEIFTKKKGKKKKSKKEKPPKKEKKSKKEEKKDAAPVENNAITNKGD